MRTARRHGGGVRKGLPLSPSRFLLGRDFFISYSRRDAAASPASLAGRLSKRFSCYLDQLPSPRGERLPASIRREVKRATVLVLVGSPAAVESTYVQDDMAAVPRKLPYYLQGTEYPAARRVQLMTSKGPKDGPEIRLYIRPTHATHPSFHHRFTDKTTLACSVDDLDLRRGQLCCKDRIGW